MLDTAVQERRGSFAERAWQAYLEGLKGAFAVEVWGVSRGKLSRIHEGKSELFDRWQEGWRV